VKTERKVLSLVAVCLLLWSAGGLGPVAGMASQPPAGGEPLAPDEPAASDVWVSPSALNLAVWEGGTATIALTIGNSGADPLEWVLSVATGGTNVVGDWIVYYDWGCVGAPGSGAFTFYSDHTFTYYIYTGTWTQTDNQVTWTFPNGTQYSGYIAGNKMAGTMNVPGCWEADRILTATVTVRSGERTASGEPAEAPGVEAEWAVPDAQPVERVRPGEGPEPPAGREGVPEIDLTTCRPAAAAPHQDLSTLLDVEAGGSVLWDLTHGVYYDYEPAGLYSSLVSLLNSAGYTVDTTAAGVNNVDLWAYDVLVVNVASAWDNAYTPAELEVIEYYVWNGGSLLVLADNLGVPNQHVEPVCRAFGALCGFGALPSPIPSPPPWARSSPPPGERSWPRRRSIRWRWVPVTRTPSLPDGPVGAASWSSAMLTSWTIPKLATPTTSCSARTSSTGCRPPGSRRRPLPGPCRRATAVPSPCAWRMPGRTPPASMAC
jgi:hypothetical protein